MAKKYPATLPGMRYSRWTVLSLSGKIRYVNTWLCRCDCGTVRNVQETSLQAKKTHSCGCYRDDVNSVLHKTHGTSNRTKSNGEKISNTEYTIWASMRTRCYNPKNRGYKNYGGRGIKICERWNDFAVFLSDMGNRPSNLHSIDRIDNDGNYCPENCRWATGKEQARNARSKRVIEYNGEVKTVAEWSEITGLGADTLRMRLNAGWEPSRALTEPVHYCGDRSRQSKRGD